MAAVTVNDLTSGTTNGTGVFDVLMQATKEHIQEEYAKGRLKGAEYSQVYLGGVQAAMQTAMQLLLEQQRVDLEAQLLAEQITTEQKNHARIDAEILNIPKQGTLLDSQAAQVIKETSLLDKRILQADEEIALAQAEVAIKEAQVDIATAELGIATAKLANIPKEGILLDKQAAHTEAQTALVTSQELKVDAETAVTSKQGLILDQQVTTEQKKHAQLDAEALLTAARTSATNADKLLTDQKVINAVTEETVLKAQECKLDAEFDVLVEQKTKVTTEVTKLGSEISLLNQKVVTEQAQVSSLGVDTDSIIGRQKALYANQANGYLRDAEQKAAKLMVDAAMTQYTTKDVNLTGANLEAADVGAVVAKLKTGVGA